MQNTTMLWTWTSDYTIRLIEKRNIEIYKDFVRILYFWFNMLDIYAIWYQ